MLAELMLGHRLDGDSRERMLGNEMLAARLLRLSTMWPNPALNRTSRYWAASLSRSAQPAG